MTLGWLAMVVAAAPLQGVDGGLSLQQVQEVVSWHSPEINACLAGAPKKANVSYRFSIRPDGRVAQLGFLAAKDAESARVTCVGTALEKFRFAGGDGGTVAQWSFSTSSFDAGLPEEEEVLAPEEFPARWVDDASSCYDATKPSPQREGRASLSLVLLPSGITLRSSASEVSAAFSETALGKCLEASAASWVLPAAPAARRVQVNWVFATSELRAKKHFLPSAPAREVVSTELTLAPGEGLDKDVIMKEIRRNNSRVKACYELRLQLDPRLAGKLSVAWVIGPAGSVIRSTVDEDTLGDPAVGTCLLGVIDHMKFPRPIGGGNVNVTFPWIFKGAGEE